MRPDAHKTGDIGLNAVERIFLDAGWVVNRIVSDYGEDLAVQPTERGTVEKQRFYVQVKSVRSERTRAISLKVADVFIWQITKEPFLLICWLNKKHKAIYIWVNAESDPQKYASKEQKTVSFDLASMTELTRSELERLRGASRVLFYSDILRHLSKYIEKRKGYTSNKRAPDVMNAKIAATRIACRIFESDGVFTRKGNTYGPSIQFLRRNLDNIIEHSFRRSGRRIRPTDELAWALFIVDYVWDKQFGEPPSGHIMWTLANAAIAVVTGDPIFVSIVRSRQAAIWDSITKSKNKRANRQRLSAGKSRS